MLKKVKKVLGKCKRVIAVAVAAVSSCAIAAVASAAESSGGTTGTFDLTTTIETTGQSIQNQFGAFVTTLIPILVAIMMSGLGIYAVFSLIKYARKIFNHVAG